MTILGRAEASSEQAAEDEGEEGFLRTCLGWAFMTSEALIEPLISST